MELNEKLVKYVEEEILPRYKKNDPAHQEDHIRYVINRAMNMAKKYPEIDSNMMYAAAAFHDLGCSVDRENHHTISAQMFLSDHMMDIIFNASEKQQIAFAIEDHRASCDHKPRNLYGEILSTADRDTNYENLIKRVWKYNSQKHSDLSNREIAEFARLHIIDKFGYNGYARKASTIVDKDFISMCDTAAEVSCCLDDLITDIKKYVSNDIDFDGKTWFDELDQYAIERDLFSDIFDTIDMYACNGHLPFEGPNFRFWCHEDEVYILHKLSGTLVNWYKIGHTGRTNTCNKNLSESQYRLFAEMLISELKAYGVKEYKW